MSRPHSSIHLSISDLSLIARTLATYLHLARLSSGRTAGTGSFTWYLPLHAAWRALPGSKNAEHTLLQPSSSPSSSAPSFIIFVTQWCANASLSSLPCFSVNLFLLFRLEDIWNAYSHINWQISHFVNEIPTSSLPLTTIMIICKHDNLMSETAFLIFLRHRQKVMMYLDH